MIHSWYFEFFTMPDDKDDPRPNYQRWQEGYQWYQKLWSELEPAGFKGIFFSEHHFMSGRMSPSPNLLVAHLAARTEQLRLGVMGMVAPLYQPWRLAEEVAMLDHLSQGRLEIGLSSGSGPREFATAGISPDELRPRYNELLEFLDKALCQPAFSHHGQFWHFENITISPRPLQQPRPPTWMTGHSTFAAEAAAHRGYKFCTAFVSIPEIQQYFDAYREAAAVNQMIVTPDNLAIRRKIIITDDDSEGREIARDAVNLWRKIMSGPPPSGSGPDLEHKSAQVPDAPIKTPKAPHGLYIADEEAIGGSPDRVAEQIIEQCRATGCSNMIGYTFGALSRQQLQRNMQLWPRVIAQLQKADIGLDEQGFKTGSVN